MKVNDISENPKIPKHMLREKSQWKMISISLRAIALLIIIAAFGLLGEERTPIVGIFMLILFYIPVCTLFNIMIFSFMRFSGNIVFKFLIICIEIFLAYALIPAYTPSN